MDDVRPPRPNPDREAARRYQRAQAGQSTDPNPQFLAEGSVVGAGGWGFAIYRLMRRLIVRRDL